MDGAHELEAIEALCAARGKRMKVLYRVTPGVKADSHDYIVTGKKDSKFGFPPDEDVIYPAVERAVAAPHVDFLGFHFHIGSQLFDASPYLQAVEAVLELVRQVRDRFGVRVSELNLGGGFGITYTTEERRPYRYYLDPMLERIAACFDALELPAPPWSLSRAAASSGTPLSPSTPWGPSKRSPACANMWRWTAA
ncbi:MAG: hypothetical protein ACLSAF_06230 [Intestinimonas sp.]